MTCVLHIGPSTSEDLFLAALSRGDALVGGTLTRNDLGLISQLCAGFPSWPLVPNAPDADRDAMEREQRTAVALARALLDPTDMVGVRDLLAHGTTDDRILIDTALPELRHAPWEILGEAAGTPFSGLRVERLLPHDAKPPPLSTGIEVLVWCPTPEDGACREVLHELRGACEGMPLTSLEAGRAVPPAGWRARVLFVITHGRSRGAGFLFGGSSAGHDAHSVRKWLQPVLESLSLVVLDVCGAGRNTLGQSATEVLVGGGAPALCASACALPTDAAVALNAAVLSELAVGATVGEAVEAGRRAMLGLANGNPGRRWWNLTLTVSGRAVGPAVVTRIPNVPRGVPTPAVELLPALDRLLEDRADGRCVGVEQLAQALLYSGTAGSKMVPKLHQLANPPWPVEESMTGPAGRPFTRRLEQLFASLRDGFDLVALYKALLAVHPLGTRPAAAAITEGRAEELETRVSQPLRAAAGALQLEVLGGPEDGRVVVLDADQPWFGRAVLSPDPHAPAPPPGEYLFREWGPPDRAVGRRHLHLGPSGDLATVASIEVLLPTLPQRWATARSHLVPAGHAFTVEPGMVLIVGSTWLEVRAVSLGPRERRRPE